MSDEIKSKEKIFELPMMPIFGVDLGERLGSLAEGQKQLGHDLQKLDARMDKLDAKIDALDDKLTAEIKALDAKLTAKIDAVDDKLTAKIEALDAKFEAKTDKMAYALNRLDERTKTDHTLLIGLWATVIAGIILQFFLK